MPFEISNFIDLVMGHRVKKSLNLSPKNVEEEDSCSIISDMIDQPDIAKNQSTQQAEEDHILHLMTQNYDHDLDSDDEVELSLLFEQKSHNYLM